MTTTYSTDDDLKLRSTLASAALATVNTARAAAGDGAITLGDYRVLAQGVVHQRLAARGIVRAAINNPDGLTAAEAALALHLLFTAAAQRPNLRNPGAVDLYAQNAEQWAAAAEREMAAAVPIVDMRPVASSFDWSRG